MKNKKFPATKIVHWPSGPVYACDYHANALNNLSKFLGGHIGIEAAPAGNECPNCKNEDAAGIKRPKSAPADPDREQYPEGVELIKAGKCPLGATTPMSCMFCRVGHMLECHHPKICQDANCSHYRAANGG